MTLHHAKTIRKKLRELAGLAHEQELFTYQSPQKLNILCEHALIKSAISFYQVFRGEL
ncbi:MAG: hypothetical protein KKI12_08580 [Proteobacteria bacterium]|nr:hypothetical protein [Pseudomonadota bacterium]